MLTKRFLLSFQLLKASRVSSLRSPTKGETRAGVPTGSIDELPKASPRFALVLLFSERVYICFFGVTIAGVRHILWMPSRSIARLAVQLTRDTTGLPVNQAQIASSAGPLFSVCT